MNLQESLKKVKAASRKLVLIDDLKISKVLLALADGLVAGTASIIEANKKDLAKMSKEDSLYDRILLNDARIAAIAQSVREIAGYDSPIDKLIEEKTLANGLSLKKVSTPIGVVGAIFEARPNVLIDTFSLCFKSKNSCVMKGGSQCEESNSVLYNIILKAIESVDGELRDNVLLLANDRKLVSKFLKMDDYVDVIVPRGGQDLIDFVRETSLIPVIETGRGVCHTYVDETADIDMAKKIILNAKTDRPSVCNALDTLIIHKDRIGDLQAICEPLAKFRVEIFADEGSFEALLGYVFLWHASAESFGVEYLGLKMSVKTVGSLEEAIEHINTFGSGHSEAIVTAGDGAEFLKAVDAACVYVNASTRFTDGGVFGLGAEVGISTQKLHARGPMGIKELTSYKWQIVGNGQVR